MVASITGVSDWDAVAIGPLCMPFFVVVLGAVVFVELGEHCRGVEAVEEDKGQGQGDDGPVGRDHCADNGGGEDVVDGLHAVVDEQGQVGPQQEEDALPTGRMGLADFMLDNGLEVHNEMGLKNHLGQPENKSDRHRDFVFQLWNELLIIFCF